MKREEALDTLAEGLAHLTTSTEWLAYLDFQRRFHQYSFFNTLMIAHQRPDATRVAGFKKWIELGRMVRKGEKGIAILVPYFGKRKDEDEDEARTIGGFGIGHVFDVKQTDGEPIPEGPKPVLLAVDDPTGASKALERIARGLGYAVEYRPLAIAGANGMCDFAKKLILVSDTITPAHQLKTMVHELAHATLHGEGSITRATAELEAESVAYCVCAELGLDTSTYSFAYVTGWYGKDALEALKSCGKRIQHATAAILDAVALVAPLSHLEQADRAVA